MLYNFDDSDGLDYKIELISELSFANHFPSEVPQLVNDFTFIFVLVVVWLLIGGCADSFVEFVHVEC